MSASLDVLSGQRILVTGGAGFIGSEVVRQLFELGAAVTVVDNLVNGKRENIEAFLGSRVSLSQVDIRDGEAMRSLVRGQDSILHLACLGVRHSLHSPGENHDVNATATLSMLQVAREFNVGRFLYVSSSEIYGTARTVPISEQHPAWPLTVYGSSKLAGERYASAYWESYGFPTVVIRPFNAYGPRAHHEGDCGEVIPKFMLRAMTGRPLIIHGDGTQTRDFTYVAETARGILLAAAHPDTVGETLNLGQGKEISINSLAEQVGAVAGRNTVEIVHTEPRPGDVLRLLCDNSKVKDLLGFAPSIELRDGLSRLRDWYLSTDCSLEERLAEEVLRTWHSER